MAHFYPAGYCSRERQGWVQLRRVGRDGNVPAYPADEKPSVPAIGYSLPVSTPKVGRGLGSACLEPRAASSGVSPATGWNWTPPEMWLEPKMTCASCRLR